MDLLLDFVKIYRSSVTRGSTLNTKFENPSLFPSMLPWLRPPGKSKRGRRSLSSEVRWQALERTQKLWCLFNFLEAGSPSIRQAAVAATARAAHGTWTAMHEEFVGQCLTKFVAM